MVSRLWFALSLIWAALWGLVLTSKEGLGLNAYGWAIVFGPLVIGLAAKRIARYTVTGRV